MTTVLTEIAKLLLVVFTTLLTIWANDYFARRRRVETYRELLYKERLQIYRDLWSKYVQITRQLGNKTEALSALGLRELSERADTNSEQIFSDRVSRDPMGPVANKCITSLIDEIEEFIAFARGVYIVLDTETVMALEAAIRIIEGKVERDDKVIDWSDLHTRSQYLQDAIRRELGIDRLRDLATIFRAG